VRVSFTLALGDANGYVITEMGLYSGNSTLMARKIRAVAVNKTSDFSPTLTWRIRFLSTPMTVFFTDNQVVGETEGTLLTGQRSDAVRDHPEELWREHDELSLPGVQRQRLG
jgi:hypothetical protein